MLYCPIAVISGSLQKKSWSCLEGLWKQRAGEDDPLAPPGAAVPNRPGRLPNGVGAVRDDYSCNSNLPPFFLGEFKSPVNFLHLLPMGQYVSPLVLF